MHPKAISRTGLALLGAALLAACGGGGGGGGSAPAPTPPPQPPPPPSPPADPLGAVGTVREEQLRLFRALANDVLGPDYQAFADASRDLSTAMDSYCDAPDTNDLEPVRERWVSAMDAWQRLQFLRDGPVEEDNRRLRVQWYWDRKDALLRGVNELLGGSADITEARVRSSNVGVQGLPALEYLLYADAVPLAEAASHPRRCQLATAIAANLRTLAGEISEPWAADGAMREDFANASGRYTDGNAVLVVILEALNVQSETIADDKIRKPVAQGNVDTLESPWARRSKDNVVTNLAAFRAVFDDDAENVYRLRDYLRRAHDGETIGNEIASAFDDADERLTAFEAGFEDVIRGEAVGDIDAVGAVFQRLERLAREAANVANVNLGFNNEDGD